MKNIIYGLVIIVIYLIIGHAFSSKLIIPDEAIRIRVIANSNSDYDQKIKNEVKNLLQNDMYRLLSNVDSIDKARKLIAESITNENVRINSLLLENDYKMPFSLNYGKNYFPAKEFNGINYPEGMYESVVVTLGDGLGDNWWCVLFPPICLLEATDTDAENIEYGSFIKDFLNKYF